MATPRRQGNYRRRMKKNRASHVKNKAAQKSSTSTDKSTNSRRWMLFFSSVGATLFLMYHSQGYHFLVEHWLSSPLKQVNNEVTVQELGLHVDDGFSGDGDTHSAFHVDDSTVLLQEDYKESNKHLISQPSRSVSQDFVTNTRSDDLYRTVNVKDIEPEVFNYKPDDLFHLWLQQHGCNGKGSDSSPILRYERLLLGFAGECPVESVLSASGVSSSSGEAECEVAAHCNDADTTDCLKGLQGFEALNDEILSLPFPVDEVSPQTIPNGTSTTQTSNQQMGTTKEQSAKCSGGGGQSNGHQAAQGGGHGGGGGGSGGEDGEDGGERTPIGGCKSDSTEVKKKRPKHNRKPKEGTENSVASQRENKPVKADIEEGANNFQPEQVTESEIFQRAQSLLNALQCSAHACSRLSQAANEVFIVVLPYETSVVCSTACAEESLVTVRMTNLRQNLEDLRQLIDSHAEDADISAAMERIARSIDCPVCRDPATSPMTVCNSGHITCAMCSFSLPKSKCPVCRQELVDYICLPEKLLNALVLPRAANSELIDLYCHAFRLGHQNPLIDNIWEIVEQHPARTDRSTSEPPSWTYKPGILFPCLDNDSDLETYEYLAEGLGSTLDAREPSEPPNNFYDARHQHRLSLNEGQNDGQALTQEELGRDDDILGAAGGDDPLETTMATQTYDRDDLTPLQNSVVAMLNEQGAVEAAAADVPAGTDSNNRDDLETDGGIDSDGGMVTSDEEEEEECELLVLDRQNKEEDTDEEEEEDHELLTLDSEEQISNVDDDSVM